LMPTTQTEASRLAVSGWAVTGGTAGTLPEVKKKRKWAPRRSQAQVGVACLTGDYGGARRAVQRDWN
jgi:hypothetical protein